MDLIFAYIAGVLTLINPCVLPILPIVLAGAVQGHRHGPLAMAAGMSVVFVSVGLFVLVLGAGLGITETTMVTFGAWTMLAFGLVLVVPAFSARFAAATAGMAGRADAQLDAVAAPGTGGLWPQFLGGALLGAVWSPCIGPTLGGAISLAAQGQSLGWATLIMAFFALGVSTIILALGYGTREAIRARRDQMAVIAQRARPLMGWTFILVAVMILTRTHHRIEAWALDVLPPWLLDLSVRF